MKKLMLNWKQREDGLWNADCPCGATLCGFMKSERKQAEEVHALSDAREIIELNNRLAKQIELTKCLVQKTHVLERYPEKLGTCCNFVGETNKEIDRLTSRPKHGIVAHTISFKPSDYKNVEQGKRTLIHFPWETQKAYPILINDKINIVPCHCFTRGYCADVISVSEQNLIDIAEPDFALLVKTKEEYKESWNKIYHGRFSWEANPKICRIEFALTNN